MRFSKKLFLSIFLVSLILGTCLVWSSHYIFARRTESDFMSRYENLSKVLGRSLIQLEASADSRMYDAARVVSLEDSSHGLLSNADLKRLSGELGVTHLFLTDKNGKFLRSTNEDPKDLPNLFSYSPSYRDLVTGAQKVVTTPIIPTHPDLRPHKFLVIPNASRSRLIEVALRADFMGRTLSEALTDDPNLVSLKVFAPDGSGLGDYDSKGVHFDSGKTVFPVALQEPQPIANGFRLYSQVSATQEHCGECDVAGYSRSGKYYYLLEMVVSNRQLSAALRSLSKVFLWIQLLVFVVSLLAARIISKKLVSRISAVADIVGGIDQLGGKRKRITIDGTDEIAFLSQRFDHLLDRLESAQNDLIIAQNRATASAFAQEVSHNIRSPIASLEGLVQKLDLPDTERNIFRCAIREIKNLSAKLRSEGHNQAVSVELKIPPTSTVGLCTEARTLHEIGGVIEQCIQAKSVELSRRPEVVIDFGLSDQDFGHFAKIQVTEFRAIISNVLNNAAEALDSRGGDISVRLRRVNDSVVVSISDNGRGVDPELLLRLGNEQISQGKSDGTGIGLFHARTMLENWGGSLQVTSLPVRGTEVSLTLPALNPPAWFATEIDLTGIREVLIVDDDESIHYLWKMRFAQFSDQILLRSFSSVQQFYAWWEAQEKSAHSTSLALIDFEFRGENTDGLAVIERITSGNSVSKAFLVTGRFDEETLLARVQWLGVKLVPKPLLPQIPILFKPLVRSGLRVTRDMESVKEVEI